MPAKVLTLIIDTKFAVAKPDGLTFTKRMPKDVNDEVLMLQYAKGDAAAFEILYQKHKASLFRFCLRHIGERAVAEECFQEIWIKLINSRDKYQPTALFTTYFYRIAKNHLLDRLRSDKKYQGQTEFDESQSYNQSDLEKEQQDSIETQLIDANQYQWLRSQIEALPLEQKTAILLKLDAGLSLDEIAHILECGRETVKSRLRYAMDRLKSCLEKSHE